MQNDFFLLAHQDDEFGCFADIEASASRGHRPVCVFITDGAKGSASVTRRNQESRSVLVRLGVRPEDIHFLGVKNGLPDGRLHKHLNQALPLLESLVVSYGNVGLLQIHAWEGGHQDHDAVHVIGTALAIKLDMLGRVRQFPLYRADNNIFGLCLFKPLTANGKPLSRTVSFGARVRYLWLMSTYSSQWRVWLVLYPLLLIAYARRHFHFQQPVHSSRVLERPHAGQLLYERRGILSYDDFRRDIDEFINKIDWKR